MRYLRSAFVAAVGLSLIATLAFGHHGQVNGAADCQSWHATVTLFDTTPDRRVVVNSTIAGTSGLDASGFAAGSGGLQIWQANGASPVAGTITLTIYAPNGHVENTSSLTLQSPKECETPTPVPSPTPNPTPRETPTLPNTAMDGS